MKLLLDTHVLLWAADGSLAGEAREMVADESNELFFSAVSLWEMVIKRQLDRADFQYDPTAVYQGLLAAGYTELAVTARHSLQVAALPPIHRDPFDRMLVAQALAEGLVLVTADAKVSGYPGSIRLVGVTGSVG